jgi:hypothetical protein
MNMWCSIKYNKNNYVHGRIIKNKMNGLIIYWVSNEYSIINTYLKYTS